MALSRLPNEILHHILRYLSPSDLLSVSLLCRAWQAHAFPHLYNTIYLLDTSCSVGESSTRVESFAKRIGLDDGNNPLSIVASVRGLVLSSGFSGHEGLKAVLSPLTRLKRLCWDLWAEKEDLELCRLFQTQCPNLEAVDLLIKSNSSIPAAHSQTLFNFANLSQFAFTLGYLPRSKGKSIDPLISLISSSPKLTSLTLSLGDPTEVGVSHLPEWLPFDVSGLVEHFEMPCLRTLRLRGCASPNWHEVLDGINTHSLRAFFLRHPGIEELEFVPMLHPDDNDYDDGIDPNDISPLFPSLKHFEGPAFLCQAIIGSTLAAQLECLVLTDHWLDDHEWDYSLFDVVESVTTLPRLRRLAILADNIVPLPVAPINRLMQAATGLEDLEIISEVDDYTEFLDKLKSLPNVRRVTPPSLRPSWKSESKEVELSWESYVRTLARACPRLEVVRKHVWQTTYEIWEITRDRGELKVVFVAKVQRSGRGNVE